MAFTKKAPELFELMRGARGDSRGDTTGRTTSIHRRRDLPTRRRRSPTDPASWWQDADGAPIVVADDDETREVLAALGLSLVAEHRVEPGSDELIVAGEAESKAGEPAEGAGGAEERGDVNDEAGGRDGAAEAADRGDKRTPTPLAPVGPLGPSAASRVPKAPSQAPRPARSSVSFAEQFLPPARAIPRRARPTPGAVPTGALGSADPDASQGDAPRGAFPRVAVRADTLAAGLAAALLLLALAFLGGRATARDPEEIAGAPGGAPALEPPVEPAADPGDPGAFIEMAGHSVGQMAAPRPAASAPVAGGAPTPAAPTAAPAGDYHIQVVTTNRENAPKIVDFLNSQPVVQASGMKAHARSVVVYVGWCAKDDPKAEALCKEIKRLEWDGKKNQFSSAYILKDSRR